MAIETDVVVDKHNRPIGIKIVSVICDCGNELLLNGELIHEEYKMRIYLCKKCGTYTAVGAPSWYFDDRVKVEREKRSEQ